MPLSVPAALLAMPPLPAGLAPVHALPSPDIASAAGPAGAGLLAKIGAALTTKAAIAAAAAAVVIGGGAVAVKEGAGATECRQRPRRPRLPLPSSRSLRRPTPRCTTGIGRATGRRGASTAGPHATRSRLVTTPPAVMTAATHDSTTTATHDAGDAGGGSTTTHDAGGDSSTTTHDSGTSTSSTSSHSTSTTTTHDGGDTSGSHDGGSGD